MLGRMLDHCPVHGTCERSECTQRNGCVDQESALPRVRLSEEDLKKYIKDLDEKYGESGRQLEEIRRLGT